MSIFYIQYLDGAYVVYALPFTLPHLDHMLDWIRKFENQLNTLGALSCSSSDS